MSAQPPPRCAACADSDIALLAGLAGRKVDIVDRVDELIDLSATAVAGADVNLVWRRDTAVLGVKSDATTKRRLVGLLCTCGTTTGYLVGLLDGRPVLSADLVLLTAFPNVLDVNIDVPLGSVLALYVHSLVGTNVCSVVAFVAHA